MTTQRKPAAPDVAAGDGMSPTVSFKNYPNLEVLAKISVFARTDLLPPVVTTATWNQESDFTFTGGSVWPSAMQNR